VDLIEMGYENYNHNYNWIYVQVDVFSRKCWLRPMKTQSAEEARDCLLSVLHEINTTPIILSTDNGGSFKDVFDEECKDVGIKHIYSQAHSPNENAIVERKNKDVRKIIRQHFIHNNNFFWCNILDKVQDNLNSTYMVSIKACPNDLWRDTNTPLTHRDFPKSMIDHNVKLQSQKHQVETGRKKIEKYKAIDNLQIGDIVRVKMSSIFKNVAKVIKSKNTKQIVVTYTPYTFEITDTVNKRTGSLERRKYVLSNDQGIPIRNANGKTKYFYASELYPIYTAEENTVPFSMEEALRLNDVESNQNDAPV
jgi:hypothetical protein